MMTKEQVRNLLDTHKGIRVNIFRMLTGLGVKTAGMIVNLDALSEAVVTNCQGLSDEQLIRAKEALEGYWELLEPAFDGPSKSTAKTGAKTGAKAGAKAAEVVKAEPAEGAVAAPSAAPGKVAARPQNASEGDDVRLTKIEKAIHALTAQVEQIVDNQALLLTTMNKILESNRVAGIAISDTLKASMVGAHFLGGGLSAKEILDCDVPGLELPDFDAITQGEDEEGQEGN